MIQGFSKAGKSKVKRIIANVEGQEKREKFVDWWIGSDGYPIEERGGVIRYFFVADDGRRYWGGSVNELRGILDDERCYDWEQYTTKETGFRNAITSFTFIPATVRDNVKLLENDPAYMRQFQNHSKAERERMFDGNWNVSDESLGVYFSRGDVGMVDNVDGGRISRVVRAWDTAGTEKTRDNPDPDWTVGVLMR